jgi:MraZ protein
MARGRFSHTMDAKGRVAIPAGFRVELQSQDGRPPILTNLVDCPAVGVFSHDRWLEIEQRLASMSQMQPEIQSVQRMLVSGAVECPVDAQGRVLVPPHLREHAGLERDVTIAGVGRRIEIWDRARFEEELVAIRERGREVSSIAAELGL